MSNDDYSAYLGATDDSKLSELQRLADLQASHEAHIAELEVQLNDARGALKDVQERLLPELMDEIGMSTFTTRSGLKIEIKEDVRASIPKAREEEAFQWMRSHNFGSLVKREIKLSFGMGEDAKADALLETLAPYEPEDKTAVHNATLKSWVTKRLESGQEIPLDLFGVHRQRRAIIKV